MRARLVALSLAVLGAFAAGQACGGPQPLGGAGDVCYRAADCKEGLVCIQGECSSDLSELEGDVTGPDEATGGGTAAAGASSMAGATATGGTAAGGTSSGGSASGGTSSGGAPTTGGTSSGGNGTGGTSTGGTSSGGASSGGTDMGGAPP